MVTIYKITNRLNNKPYVGQMRQRVEKRFLQHAKAHTPLGDAMRDCGLENFTIEVIKRRETQSQANERELFRIRVFNCRMPNGYNRSNGGEGHVHIERHPQKATVMNIAQLREQHGLNQKELAESPGMNRSVLNRIKNGTRPVRYDELKLFAAYFNVSADYLLGCDAPALSDKQATLLKGFDALNTARRKLLVAVLDSLRVSHAAAKISTRSSGGGVSRHSLHCEINVCNKKAPPISARVIF